MLNSDTNKDNVLELDELEHYVRLSSEKSLTEDEVEKEARKMLHECDFSYAGTLDFHEFLIFIGTHLNEEKQDHFAEFIKEKVLIVNNNFITFLL